jgi:hypothetical protein
MSQPFNRQKCLSRNRLAARRDGVNAIPMRVLTSAPVAGPEADLHYAQGSLPDSPEAALTRINQLLPEGAAALTPDAVYLHYVEAGNNNYIPSYFMFLSDRTLRNISQDALAGFAFMNSHRTGGLSHPAELPFGRTFAGRYEQFRAVGDAPPVQRALLGFYMLRGVRPNGDQGPSTDDLHTAILGGTLFDVSLGIGGGQVICDICGNDVDGPDCTHVPGTHANMTADNRAAQRARGVPGGIASYTLDDGHANEFSGVYDGAVPGAGFRKTLALARRRELTLFDLAEARHAYASLLRKGDLPMDEARELIREELRTALADLHAGGDARILTGVTELRAADPAPDSALAAERERNTQLEARLAKMEEQGRLDYVAALVRSHQLLPARRAWALQKLTQAALDDARSPEPIAFFAPDGTARTGTRVESVKVELEAAPAHDLTRETLAQSSALFAVGATPPPTAEATEAAAARETGRAYAASTNPAPNGHK